MVTEIRVCHPPLSFLLLVLLLPPLPSGDRLMHEALLPAKP